MTSKVVLDVAKKIARGTAKVGKEFTKDFVSEAFHQEMEKQHRNKSPGLLKTALGVGAKVAKVAKSARGGPREHLHSQHKGKITKHMLYQLKHPYVNPSDLQPIVGKKKQDLSQYKVLVPFPNLPTHEYDSSCDALYANNHGEFYICKKDSDKCTYIHSSVPGELRTIAEANPDCLKDIPLHTRKCNPKSTHILSNNYAIYKCPEKDEEEKHMYGGRYTRRGRRSRRYTRKRGLKK